MARGGKGSLCAARAVACPPHPPHPPTTETTTEATIQATTTAVLTTINTTVIAEPTTAQEPNSHEASTIIDEEYIYKTVTQGTATGKQLVVFCMINSKQFCGFCMINSKQFVFFYMINN